MARPTLQAITAAIDTNNSLQKINENFDAIEEGFTDTLSRSGNTPNYMDTPLDMNGNRITNLPNAVNATEPVTLAQAGTIAGFTSLTQATVGSYLWPRTVEEIAAAVTPTAYYYPPGDVRRYGAVGDGLTDDYTAIQAALDTGHVVVFQQATYRIDTGLTWDNDYGIIEANGAVLTTANDIVALQIGSLGVGNVVVSPQIRGYLHAVNTGGASTKQGFLLCQVQQGHLELSCTAFYVGIELKSDAAGCVYNKIYPNYIWNCYYGIYINPTLTGWVNENLFTGGRFATGSGQTKGWLIYMPQGVGTYGAHNNNRFLGPSLECGATSTMEGFYLDGGFQNQLHYPRVESGSATINVREIYLNEDSVGAMVFWPYSSYQATGAFQNVEDAGIENIIFTPDRLQFNSRQAGASPVLELRRQDGNNSFLPMVLIDDLYAESQASCGIHVRLARNNATFPTLGDGYALKVSDIGSIRDHGGREYECILSHTSTANDEPGVGVNWETYWKLLPTSTASGTNWSLATAYTGTAERAKITQHGTADFRNLIVRDAAGATDSGDVMFGTSTQTTVGAAGAASALPATPSGYLRFYIGTTEYVLPYYAQA